MYEFSSWKNVAGKLEAHGMKRFIEGLGIL